MSPAMGRPRSRAGGSVIPMVPFVRDSQWIRTYSMMNWPARVAIVR